MKKGFFLIFMMLLSFPIFAADELYVRQSGGDTKFNISSIKEITFPSGQVVVTMTDGSSKSYSSSSFVSLRFDGKQNVGIENVSEVADNIIFDGVNVRTSQAGIMIYSTDGRLVLSSEDVLVNVSSLASGIYIVKAGGLTSKIVK